MSLIETIRSGFHRHGSALAAACFLTLLLLGVASSYVWGWQDFRPVPECTATDKTIALSISAENAQCRLRSFWTGTQPGAPETAEHYAPLRNNLIFDTWLIVPGYVGLFCVLAVTLTGRWRSGRNWLPHLICLLPVLTGMADWIENGLTYRVMLDVDGFAAGTGLLTDGDVADLHLISQAKWYGIAGALVLLAFLALREATAPFLSTAQPSKLRIRLLAGAALCAVAAALLYYAVVQSLPSVFFVGMLTLGAAGALLTWALWLVSPARSSAASEALAAAEINNV